MFKKKKKKKKPIVTSAGDCNYIIVRVKVDSCSQNMTFSCMVWCGMLHFKLLHTVLCISITGKLKIKQSR